MEKHLLRGFGLVGILVFIPLFIFTFADPHVIEKSGRSFIEWKLKKETNKKIDSVQLPQQSRLEKILGKKAEEMRHEAEDKLQNLKQQLKDDLPAILADELAKLNDLSCECRKYWEERLRSSIKLQIINIEVAKEKIADFSQAKYMEIVEKLTLDVRIFLGTNAVVFLFLFLVSFMKPQAIRHLFLPGGLLFLSSLICSYFYLFEQNWFYTIIYNDYTGYGFVAYLVIVFAFLCDIVFNKARVTTEILNSMLEVLGHAASFSPC